MRIIRRIALVSCIPVIVGCGGGTGGVEGLVIERERQVAVEEALVRIQSQEGDGGEQFTFTDINGRYSFQDVPEGLNQVRIIKEGYNTDPGTCNTAWCKFADVVEGETLTLDFVSLNFIGRTAQPAFHVRMVDDRGPVRGATVDLYRGPCIGSGDCSRNLAPNPLYEFLNSISTDANGEGTFPPILAGFRLNEFNEYLFQLRAAAPGHQNQIFDFSVTIDTIPPVLQFVLPRL